MTRFDLGIKIDHFFILKKNQNKNIQDILRNIF